MAHTEGDLLTPRRIRVRITGVVQGVGFRPFVFRLAEGLALGGHVLNDGRGVLIEAEGASSSIDQLLARLPREAPALARIADLEVEELEPCGPSDFRILESALPADRAGGYALAISPDVAPCAECLAELHDSADRRFRYPFINCTACGPRYTIIESLPYDRARTTMAPFEMCERCRAEYGDPHDRRFHAQPNACPACGPALRLVAPDGGARDLGGARDAIGAAAAAIRDGAIVALKGVGGFHLACRADQEEVVARLRARKHRPAKPFALMVGTLEMARALLQLAPEEEELLTSPERPILLARRRASGQGAPARGPELPLAAAVAPGTDRLGVLLPCTPLHHLLLSDLQLPLVMTSGNRSDDPILHRDDEALRVLGPIADLFLLHDREIRRRADDSILIAFAPGGPAESARANPDSETGRGPAARAIRIRHSRGFVPLVLPLPIATPQTILACGAQQKSAFCLAHGDRAWLGPHIGDLGSYESYRLFRQGVEEFSELLGLTPEVVAHDLHPDYLATRYALDRSDLDPLPIQHHHAHFAAALAAQGERGPAIGAIFDGAGYGPDGIVWGGEILVGTLAQSTRIGHLWPVALPGGDAAAREPVRLACAWLHATYGENASPPPTLGRVLPIPRWDAIFRLVRSERVPRTTSAGRLFDAVAALLGIRTRNEYEAHAAIALEALADPEEEQSFPMPIRPAPRPGDPFRLDPRPMIDCLVRELQRGMHPSTLSARFHNCLADATARACACAARDHGTRNVVLAGGVFQNQHLLRRTIRELERRGCRPLVSGTVPLNDGGIAFGQAACAAARLAASTTV